MRQIQLIKIQPIEQTPYITAYLATLLKFIQELQLDDVTLENFIPLFKGISAMGRKAERTQKLKDFLQNNITGHLEAIIEQFGFPMTFGETEYHELNTYFNEACGSLKLIPFKLFFTDPTQTRQTVVGNYNVSIDKMTSGQIIVGNNNTVGQVNQHFGNSVNINTNGGDFAAGGIHIGDTYL